MTPYYEDDAVTIYHGDCREIITSLSGVAAVVTSPPYNQLDDVPAVGSGMWGESEGMAGFVRSWSAMGYSDKMPEASYQAWQNELFASIRAVCVESASLFYNHQLRWRDGVLIHPVEWFRPEGWKMRQEIVWDKGGGMMFNARMFVRFDERVLWFVAGDSWTWNQTSVGHGTIWRIAREQQQQGKLHPVAFPMAIPTRCIAATTSPGDIVLDPFMGSGTTLRAAKDMGRRAVGVEIDERYCEIAVKRIAQQVLDVDAA